jgi:acyl-CoA dehydrogenase
MSIILLLISALLLAYLGTGGRKALIIMACALLLGWYLDAGDMTNFVCASVILLAIMLVLIPNQYRRNWLSRPLLSWVRGMLPKLSETETEALRSGSVDWDGELFSGHPDWSRLLKNPHAKLTADEQAFIDGPVTNLCDMLDDWSITNELYDLPQDAWDYIGKQGFLGLITPEEYGGKGFSQTAHSEIVMKLSTRSVSAAVTVMVPNSLGPAELLMEYGTEEQKSYYLPRLSSGEDIPCFALTSPVAGSDAGAIPDKGIVCMGDWEGKQVLGLKVTWNKRYITLAPVATIIGLAIKVYDPEQLLGPDETIGVTCVMIPRHLPGVNSGTRHLPMNSVFMNGPTWGNEVFIPMEQVIGGQAMLGKGWTMLLECLSIGRSISLPALAAGAGKVASLTAGSYACVREQFGRSIKDFEGVQEALEPIAGYSYMMDAARLLTTSMLDRGVRPAVPSALLKYRNTDLMRTVINHAMDVVAGRGVITGPRNFMARIYQAVPIAITVEGANILTRSLMIFGQGAIRCHPYIVEEIEAAGMEDKEEAISRFDAVFFQHIGHTTRNILRSLLLGLSGGRLEQVPSRGNLQRYYRQLSRFSAAYSLLTDVTLLSIGGGLKARQRLSGHMADCLVQLYYASAVIKQWHEEGYPESERQLVHWCLQTCLYELQKHMRELINNFPVAVLRWPLRLVIFPLGSGRLRKPNDKLGTDVAMSIVADGPTRDRIVRGVYQNAKPDDSLGRVLNAYRLANETQALRNALHKAVRNRDPDDLDGIALLMGHERKELVDWAVEQKIINETDREILLEALTALYDVIRVDAFDAAGISAIAKYVRGKRQVVERGR